MVAPTGLGKYDGKIMTVLIQYKGKRVICDNALQEHHKTLKCLPGHQEVF